jgi:hypothetical protein
MAQAAKAIASPGERVVFQYTTSLNQAAEEARGGVRVHTHLIRTSWFDEDPSW